MELPKVIDQLKELIADRESFIYSDGEARRIYIADKEALEEAVKVQYVMAAEQQIRGAERGIEKTKYVEELLDEDGVTVTGQVRAMIEAAVYRMQIGGQR